MEKVIWGESLENKIADDSLKVFKNSIINGNLQCNKIENVKNGDIRYWEVDPNSNELLKNFYNFAIEQYQNKKNKKPSDAKIMINYIDFEKCPTGSGSGWHRDMWRDQYKAFMYLEKVERGSQGAFSFLDNSNSYFPKTISLFNRIFFGGNRYNNWYINVLKKLGYNQITVLSDALKPFFLNTSLIHRGLEIKEGYRLMATVYLYD